MITKKKPVEISAKIRERYDYYKQNNRERQENHRTIGRYVFSNFFKNFISLVDKWYQTTNLVNISVQTMEKYGHYKQINREQQEIYRTIERYIFSTFFNTFIYVVDKQYQNTSLVQISASVRHKYGYYKQSNREQYETYRTIGRYVFSPFFNNFISLIDK